MKKKIIFSFLFFGMLLLTSNIKAQGCSQSGNTATCVAQSSSTLSYDSHSDYYYLSSGIPITFSVDLLVNGSGSNNWAGTEVDWGSANMWWYTSFDPEYHTTLNATAGENDNGMFWIWVTASSGTATVTATW